jgi:hypothetical protein
MPAEIGYTYATGLDANTSRLSSMTVGAQVVEGYNYLGLGTVVKRTHSGAGQPGVDLTYVKLAAEAVGDAGDQYTGLDRFGRVVDQRWVAAGRPKNDGQKLDVTFDKDLKAHTTLEYYNTFPEGKAPEALGMVVPATPHDRRIATMAWTIEHNILLEAAQKIFKDNPGFMPGMMAILKFGWQGAKVNSDNSAVDKIDEFIKKLR